MRLFIVTLLLVACSNPGVQEYETEDSGLPEADIEETQDSDITNPDARQDAEVPDRDADSDDEREPDSPDSDVSDRDEPDEPLPDADSEVEEDAEPDTVEPRCEDYEELCGEECIDVRSDPENCGGCGISCSSGRLAECVEGMCIGWTDCFEGFGSGGVASGNCSDVCPDEGAAEDAEDCVIAIAFLENPAEWALDGPRDGWERCEDPERNPQDTRLPLVPIVWSCCCRW